MSWPLSVTRTLIFSMCMGASVAPLRRWQANCWKRPVGFSFNTEHLKRYKDFALLLWKYGRGDLVQHAGLSDMLPDDSGPAPAAPGAADALAADVERLGPSAFKLGQLLSTRPDL